MKIRKCSLWFVLTLLPTFSLQAEPVETRMIDRIGSVYVHLAGTPADDLIEAPNESALDEGDQIVTGDYSSVRLILDGDSIIELGSNSDFTIQKLEGPSFDFMLAGGQFLAKIKSLFEKKKSMNVRTPVAVAAVRGTEFGLTYDEENGTSDIGVFDEGEVSVESTSTGEKATLIPGNETTVVRGLGRITPRPLHKFEGMREQFVKLRERRDAAWRDWKAKSIEERTAFREKLRRERAIKRHDVPQLRPQAPRDRMRRNDPPRPAPRPHKRERKR